MNVTVRVPRGADRVAVLGAADRNLKMIREALGVNIAAREDSVHVSGDPGSVQAARLVLERLADAPPDTPLSRREVLGAIADAASRVEVSHTNGDSSFTDLGPTAPTPTWTGELNVRVAGRPVRPRSLNQAAYVEAIHQHDLVFCSGPAGSGKTYLAVASAVHLLRAGAVRKVVLVRPAVEAGEKLGFLPGDMQAKVHPYLRPLFDALHDMMDYQTLKRLVFNDVIEVAPLAFMRGRTLNHAVIILDEAQNTTKGQMHMFLTRMGQGSKMIVTGDTTQVDLPDPRDSGLIDAARRLRRTQGVAFLALDREDIVRHSLVQRIVEAYGADPDDPPGDSNGRADHA
ncbi:MAG: PhoH family protein [Phycisphaerales bacterium]